MENGGDVSAGRNHAEDGIPLGGGRQDDGGPAPKGREKGAGGDAEEALPAHPPPRETDPAPAQTAWGLPDQHRDHGAEHQGVFGGGEEV